MKQQIVELVRSISRGGWMFPVPRPELRPLQISVSAAGDPLRRRQLVGGPGRRGGRVTPGSGL